MLRFIRQGQRWIVTALVVMVGAVFILFFGPWDFTQTGAAGTALPVQVDGVQYSIQDVERVRGNLEQRYREALGDQFDAVAAKLELRDLAVRELVDRAILAGEARRLGLAASDAEVDQLIRQVFSEYRDEQGRLDEEGARQFVIYEWGSVRRFKEEVRTDLVLRKLGRLLLATAGASRAEAHDALAYREQEVRIAFVALDPAAPAQALEVLPGDVEEFQRREVARIADYYQQNLARFELPERLRLRHVLVRFGGDEEVARVRAETAHERVANGEDMAEVAREVSDDLGSTTLGGDLGLLPAHEIAAALRDAVATLSPGELAPLVRGEQGFHVVRLEERLPAETRALADAAPAIAEEIYRAEQAQQWASRTARDLGALVAAGSSLEEAARELRLGIERTDFFRRRPDGFIPDVGDSPEVQIAAFALSPEAPTWPRPIPMGERTVFIQLLERREPAGEGLEARVDTERERLQELAQQRVEQTWLSERRSLLQAEGRIRIDASALE